MKLGPIRTGYHPDLEFKQGVIAASTAFIMYLIALYGVLGFSYKNMLISTVYGTIIAIGLKQYFVYKNTS